MEKNSTPVKTTFTNKLESTELSEMNPSQKTLKNILQFAAAYRVEKVPKDRYIEYFLN
ncbi:MAG: hypothetical protein GX361_01715 [Bacteroidales bacterium]|nr:hypothetical protein [Bacteroidales bacterium]